jgi:regulator of protease activity HflC (stomatin/prohibitin superfamily)
VIVNDAPLVATHIFVTSLVCKREVIRVVAALVIIIVLLIIAGLTAAGRSFRVVQQYEKGIIYRFGRVLPEVRGPGLHVIRPIGDRMQKVNMQIVAMAVPAQDGITRDNVSVRVDAVVYFRVVDPIKATVNVQDYMFAIAQQAQTSLRSIIGQSEMDQLLAERESVNRELRRVIDEPTEAPWGIRVERVEVKDVSLPEGMKRSMSRQAEAERERRARIITADGEYQASKRLAAAANVMARDPAALQLRLLQTVVEVAGERNSTLVMPVPVELLRFFDRMTPGASRPAEARPEEPEDLGDAEVAEAEAEISMAHVAALEDSEVPPVPEVEPVSDVVPELPSAAAEPDLAPLPEPEGLPSSEVPPSPVSTAPASSPADAFSASPVSDSPVSDSAVSDNAVSDSAVSDNEATASLPVVDPAITDSVANGTADGAIGGVADESPVPPARKPRSTTPRKPRTPAAERKPRATGERTPRQEADR